MKKVFFFLFPVFLYSQNYIGLHADNYNGVHGVLFNPANIVDSNFRTDVNIASVSANLDNDFYSISIKDVIKGNDVDFDNESSRSLKKNNNFYMNVGVLGPAFMLNIKPKHSIAVYSRARIFANVNEINGTLYDVISEDFNSQNEDFEINEDRFKLSSHAWGEIGVTYATILVNKDQHFLKGGLTLKYLQGLGNVNVEGKDIRVDYSSNDETVDTNGELNYSSSHDVADGNYEVVSGANGLGTDLGFVYEWRPENKDSLANKYKLKFGFAITDIGKVKYNAHKNKKYLVNGTDISENTFEDNEFDDALEMLYTSQDLGKSIKVSLPTALHLQADWNINNKFYLNINSDLSLTAKDKEKANNIISQHILTPRFETKWFTTQLPLTYTALGNFKAGFGFRFGPLYLGSGSVLTNLFSDKTKSADIYVGLKVPIYKKNN